MVRILPGPTVEGTVLSNGQRLTYTLSGHLQFWLTLLAMGHGAPLFSPLWEGWGAVYRVEGFRPLRLEMAYDSYLQLATASVLFSFALSIYL